MHLSQRKIRKRRIQFINRLAFERVVPDAEASLASRAGLAAILSTPLPAAVPDAKLGTALRSSLAAPRSAPPPAAVPDAEAGRADRALLAAIHSTAFSFIGGWCGCRG